jgi:crotonobetainyl-CoA:carnitine CoA-transferase CaiB-like acyl-CoA transferase
MSRLRVLELGSGVAVGYCGRLLAMMGADVTRLEHPADDGGRSRGPIVQTERGPVSGLREYLDCYKRSAAVAPNSPAGRRARHELYRRADVVIEYHEGDPEPIRSKYEQLHAVNPGIVHVVVSPFGLTGPYRSYLGNEFIDMAASGHLYITGDPFREPVQAGGPWSAYAAGTIAAIGALAARNQAERTGEGRLLDIASVEAMASLHQWSLIIYTHTGYVKGRWGNRMAESYYPYSFFRCSDGWVCIGAASPIQWEGFCHALDMAEFLGDERFQTGADRFDRADELDATICPKLLEMTTIDTIARMQEHRVPAGPVLSVIQTLLDDQLSERGFWAPLLAVGPGAKVPERAFHLEGEAAFRPAPRQGEHTEAVLREAGLSESDIRQVASAGIGGSNGGSDVP